MPYLSNAAVNRLNLHTGLHMLAYGLCGQFLVAFLLTHGFGLPGVFLALAGVFAARLVVRPAVLWVVPRVGSTRGLFVGSLCFAIEYLFVSHIDGVGPMFFAACLFYAAADAFYWTMYHTIFACLGDEIHRGKQVGARQASMALFGILGPLAGGLAIARIGATATFAVAAAMEAAAVLPLLRIPTLPVERLRRPEATREATGDLLVACLLFMSDGWLVAGFSMLWGALLFGATGASFALYGIAISIVLLAGAAAGLFLGGKIDGNGAVHAAFLNALLVVAVLVLKIAVVGTGLDAMLVVAVVGAFLMFGYDPVLMTAMYSLAARSPAPFRFVFVTECAWDVGCIAGCLLTAAMLSAEFSPRWIIAASAIGIVGQVGLLCRHYAGRTRS